MKVVVEHLKREMGLGEIVALGINCVVGTGIFFLPGKAAAMLGPAALYAYVLAAVLCTILVLCFAEVGSRFTETGGVFLYSRAAFGEVVGFAVGWVTWSNRIVAWAALANAWLLAGESLFPGFQNYRVALLIGLFGVLALANICGVNMGAHVTSALAVLKVAPIVVFIVAGLWFVRADLFVPFAPHGVDQLADGTLLIFYAFTGFEGLTIPVGEMRNPQRNVPLGLLITLAAVLAMYLGIWAVCTGTLPTLAGSNTPVADAARIFLGPWGAWLIAVGIFLSVLGINSGAALIGPRSLYALAHAGMVPGWLGSLSARSQTPVVATVITSLLACCLAIGGNFTELAVFSVVARFAQYVPTCLAMMVLRTKERSGTVNPATFRAPGGSALPILGLGLCGWLLYHADFGPTHFNRWAWSAALLGLGALLYAVSKICRQRPEARNARPPSRT